MVALAVAVQAGEGKGCCSKAKAACADKDKAACASKASGCSASKSACTGTAGNAKAELNKKWLMSPKAAGQVGS